MSDPGRSADFVMADNDENGPQTELAAGRATIKVQFALGRVETVATASAGALLAQAHGGQLRETAPTIAAFGVARPTAMLAFPHPVSIAGFRFDELRVRTADFAGNAAFPADPAASGDIVIRKKIEQQRGWPVVLIGGDRLDRCSEAVFHTIEQRLTLRCAAEGVS